MKRILAFILTLCLMATLVPFTVSAAKSGYYTYTVGYGKATITDVSTSISGDVVIPSTLGGYPVTSIGKNAFNDCRSLTSVTIPDSVTSIGDYAFYICSSLTNVTIPDSVTSIGDYAFYACSSLTNVTIPDSVTSIGDYVFFGCERIASIDIPDSLASIGDYAFYSCEGLTSITIPDSVTSIGDSAFDLCTMLTSVYITNIESWLKIDFASSSSNPLTNADNLYLNGELVTEVFIPKSITDLKAYAFYACSSLTNVTIHDGVISIGDGVFSSCSSLTSITIPDSVTSIGDYAFSSCSNFTSITIPDNITSIGRFAFSSCSSLTSIIIPDSLTSIGNYAFLYCNRLTSITVDENNLVYHSDGNCLIETKTGKLIQGCNNSAIPSDGSVTSIGDYAFWGCTSLKCITIPDNVTSIGNRAFYNCANLKSVNISNSVMSIGFCAFMYCDSLKSIKIGDSVTFIGDTAFYGCYNLSTVFYNGTESSKNLINIGRDNTNLTNAKWHYEVSDYILDGQPVYYCGKCELLYKADGTKVPLSGLSLISPPNKVSYTVGGVLDLTGISLQLIYSDDLTIFVNNIDSSLVSADLTTPEKKTVKITIDGVSVEFEIYVHEMMLHSVDVDPSLYPQSSHNYETDLDDTQTFTYPDAESLAITFDAQTETENGYDFIYVYDGNGVQIAKYTGTNAANQTLTISGDTFKIRLTSDESTVKYGYAFSSIKAITGEEIAHNYSEKWTTNETDHWYECTICGDKKDFSEHSVEDGVCKECGKAFYTLGDVDGEEGITANDAIYVLYNVFFGDESYPVDQPCDFDGDNSVTANDAIYLLYHVFFGDESYPLI